jgi:hypothetical protein
MVRSCMLGLGNQDVGAKSAPKFPAYYTNHKVTFMRMTTVTSPFIADRNIMLSQHTSIIDTEK